MVFNDIETVSLQPIVDFFGEDSFLMFSSFIQIANCRTFLPIAVTLFFLFLVLN
jgi:hypothetical protein